MQAALFLREKQELRKKKRRTSYAGYSELPAHVSTRHIAPFPKYPPSSWVCHEKNTKYIYINVSNFRSVHDSLLCVFPVTLPALPSLIFPSQDLASPQSQAFRSSEFLTVIVFVFLILSISYHGMVVANFNSFN